MFKIVLNEEAAAVLLRCLSYGEAAVSQQDHQDGTAAVIEENVQMVRKNVCNGLSKMIITKTLERGDDGKDATE